MYMGCPFLCPEKEDLICKASMTDVPPSVFEMDTYCATGGHNRCQVLVSHRRREGRERSLEGA